ncbi:uncharacterized protein LOC142791735 [Rhipicephalus microplus]|uniref:uncharacterized protein LOC142791735 n=1 Tax=Rhipicephalus microplus TaxID=6941 RepID=UPI003F6B3F2B
MEKLRVRDLLDVCEQLGVSVARTSRKGNILDVMRAEGITEEEVEEAMETIKEKQREAEERQKREEAEERRKREGDEAEERKRREERQHALRMKELELEQLRITSAQSSSLSVADEMPRQKTQDLILPFRTGGDIALFLVNFERTCEKIGINEGVWSQKLLSVIPGEAAEVIARLSKEDSDDYAKVKAALLRKYRLSAEAFRQRFRQAKRGSESCTEFVYQLKSNLKEWLRSADAYGNHDRVIDCVALEQFYRVLPEDARLWLQDRMKGTDIDKAAELADEYYTRRNFQLDRDDTKEKRDSSRRLAAQNAAQKMAPPRNEFSQGATNNERERRKPGEAPESTASARERVDTARAFESKRPIVCYNCKKEGHISSSCKQKFVFTGIRESDENLKLLEPYMREIVVNGKKCRALRDSAATMDVAHPSCISPGDYTGECAWIRQVAEEQSACLPIAAVVLEGSFGKLRTEAAVSPNLPQDFPYLFSNKSEQLLKEKGQSFSSPLACMALTRSRSRALAGRLEVSVSNEEADEREATPQGDSGQEATSVSPDIEDSRAPDTVMAAERDEPVEVDESRALQESVQSSLLGPTSTCWEELSKVDRNTLVTAQASDDTIKNLQHNGKEGVARKNISFYTKAGLMYRKYRDAEGRTFDQLLVPEKYRRQFLELAHGNAWAGHLGIKKTKARLAQDFYWPGCWKDVENSVRSCDTCQRVGKSTDKRKSPMRLVPVITEPFRRLVIDIVGPLPEFRSGCRYILTVLCVGTKFPEAVPLKELTSPCIVDALLSIFARVGFPAEIQSDNGSVFTSCLTTAFFERCGIKIIHSSIGHPQSNPVERMHAVLKRVLRALCFEHDKDWEACIPAALFAIRSAPHETTGFSPAELVYGRNLRSPFRLLRDSWEGYEEDPRVVSYVLDLLEKLSKTRELVEENMKAAQSLAKTYYDKLSRKRTFNIGDQVMLLRQCKKNKMDMKWEGPAKVMSKLSDTNYEVKLGRKKVIPCRALKITTEWLQPQRSTSIPPSEPR